MNTPTLSRPTAGDPRSTSRFEDAPAFSLSLFPPVFFYLSLISPFSLLSLRSASSSAPASLLFPGFFHPVASCLPFLRPLPLCVSPLSSFGVSLSLFLRSPPTRYSLLLQSRVAHCFWGFRLKEVISLPLLRDRTKPFELPSGMFNLVSPAAFPRTVLNPGCCFPPPFFSVHSRKGIISMVSTLHSIFSSLILAAL